MDISKRIAEMKTQAGFQDNVGMILIHNGVVRNWSRIQDGKVSALEVTPDYDKLEEIRQEFLQAKGIFDIVIEAREGTFRPGDDLLYLIVAGDIREHIKPVLSDLLDRVKSEAISKKELTS